MRLREDWKERLVFALLFIVGGALIGIACQGCGHVKPPPPSDCLTACAHLQQLGCSTSSDLCGRLCSSVVQNQPGFPGCVAAAETCAAADACGAAP